MNYNRKKKEYRGLAVQPTMDKYIFALDQSTDCTGWALYKNGSLEDFGKFQTNGKYLERISKLREWVRGMILQYNFRSDFTIAIEEIQLQQIPGTSRDGNIVTFKKLAHCQGVLLELFTKMDVKYEIVSASSWKSSCGVKGRARAEQKRNAQKYVLEEFGVQAIQDIVDAICIGKHLVLQDAKVINWD